MSHTEKDMNTDTAEGYGLREGQRGPEDPFMTRRRDELVAYYTEIGKRIQKGALSVTQFAEEQAESDLKKEEDRDHDPLTGLLNRRGFFNSFDEIFLSFRRVLHQASVQKNSPQRVTPGCFILLDLDNFGIVNKTHGDAFGDAVLQQVALALFGILRPGDLLARFGGEEFAIFLPGANLKNAANIVESRIREQVPEWTANNLDGFRQEISLGIAQLPDNLTETDLMNPARRTELFQEVYQNAIEAMRFAKLNGKNRTAIKNTEGVIEIATPELLRIV